MLDWCEGVDVIVIGKQGHHHLMNRLCVSVGVLLDSDVPNTTSTSGVSMRELMQVRAPRQAAAIPYFRTRKLVESWPLPLYSSPTVVLYLFLQYLKVRVKKAEQKEICSIDQD